MKLLQIFRPDGTFAGWISPSLIVRVDASGRYADYYDWQLKEMRSCTTLFGTPSIGDQLGLKREGG